MDKVPENLEAVPNSIYIQLAETLLRDRLTVSRFTDNMAPRNSETSVELNARQNGEVISSTTISHTGACEPSELILIAPVAELEWRVNNHTCLHLGATSANLVDGRRAYGQFLYCLLDEPTPAP